MGNTLYDSPNGHLRESVPLILQHVFNRGMSGCIAGRGKEMFDLMTLAMAFD